MLDLCHITRLSKREPAVPVSLWRGVPYHPFVQRENPFSPHNEEDRVAVGLESWLAEPYFAGVYVVLF